MSITKLDCMELKDTRYSVYPYDGYNLEEILAKFYEAIKECNDLSFSLQEFNTWLIDRGLLQEVEKQLSKVNWDNVINSELYQQIINELNLINGNLENKANKVDLDKAIENLNLINVNLEIKANNVDLDKAIEDLKNNKKEIEQFNNIYCYKDNKIEDLTIRNYSQELTLTDEYEHYNTDLYGKCTLKVSDNVATISGCVNKVNDNANFSLTLPNVIMKSDKSTIYTTLAMSSDWGKTNNIYYFMNKDGTTGLESTSFNLDKECNKYISISPTFNISKEYLMQSHISGQQDLINRAKFLNGKNTSVIVHAPDIHIRPYDNIETSTIQSYNIYTPKFINWVNKNINAFVTICNGDTMTESNKVKTKELLMLQGTDIRRMFSENTLFVLGNHDDGSLLGDSEYLTKTEFNNIFNYGKQGISFNSVYEPYYIADDTIGKCRHIILNTHDGEGRKIGLFKIGVEQIRWLVNALKSTPNFSICLWCHTPLNIQTDDVVNSTQVKQILRDYKNRVQGNVIVEGVKIEYDFTKCKGLIAGVISGHEHIDNNIVIDGINYINDKNFGSEFNISIVISDLENRKLRVLRNNNRENLTLDF